MTPAEIVAPTNDAPVTLTEIAEFARKMRIETRRSDTIRFCDAVIELAARGTVTQSVTNQLRNAVAANVQAPVVSRLAIGR
jgi:hypothetical protein